MEKFIKNGNLLIVDTILSPGSLDSVLVESVTDSDGIENKSGKE